MNACVIQRKFDDVVPPWATLHETVLYYAQLADGRAHLEAADVPTWVAEGNELTMTGTACEAMNALKDKPLAHLNALMVDVCKLGEAIPIERALELVITVRALLLNHCAPQAQLFVEREGG